MTVFVYEDVTATWAGGDEQSSPAPSHLAEGRAMLDAVTADFRAIGMQLVGGAPGFCEVVSKSEYTLLIAPECEGRLEHLANEVLRLGGKLLGPTPEAIRLTADKFALARHWGERGVPTPHTWPLGEEPTDLVLVVKPRDGAGSQAICLRPPSGRERLSSPNALVAQEYISGFSASVAFLVGTHTVLPLIPCEQILSSDGRFRYLGGRLPIAPGLAERAERIASAAVRCVPGLSGYIGVDVVLGDDGRDWAIEINPRITTSYVGLRALAKFNLAEAMLAVVQRKPRETMEWYDHGVEFTPDGCVTVVSHS